MKNNNILDFLEKTCKQYNSENKTDFYAEKTLDGNYAIDVDILNYSLDGSSCYVLFEAIFKPENQELAIKASHYENISENQEQNMFCFNYISVKDDFNSKESFKTIFDYLKRNSANGERSVIKVDLISFIKIEEKLIKSLNFFRNSLIVLK